MFASSIEHLVLKLLTMWFRPISLSLGKRTSDARKTTKMDSAMGRIQPLKSKREILLMVKLHTHNQDHHNCRWTKRSINLPYLRLPASKNRTGRLWLKLGVKRWQFIPVDGTDRCKATWHATREAYGAQTRAAGNLSRCCRQIFDGSVEEINSHSTRAVFGTY